MAYKVADSFPWLPSPFVRLPTDLERNIQDKKIQIMHQELFILPINALNRQQTHLKDLEKCPHVQSAEAKRDSKYGWCKEED